jgi:hypothetical protein
MSYLRHIHWYPSRADLIWPVSPFKDKSHENQIRIAQYYDMQGLKHPTLCYILYAI